MAAASIAKTTTRKYSAEQTRRLARTLNVDPEWLRTGIGEPTRHLAATPKAEAAAIFEALTPEKRAAWLATGRAMVAVER
jgi:hypothetical protein